ncbi:hypothetical protein FGU46_01185 [Methanobacterium sp. CWC-01]|nr:hypothetical protein FGU46_01185 [Methanobacterium sp. CWC-01]
MGGSNSGGNSKSNFRGWNTFKKKNSYWNGDIPWASVKDLDNKKYKESTLEFITEEGLNNSSSKLIPTESLIISTRMGLGRGFINKKPISINQDLKGLIPTKIIKIEFLYYWYVQKSDYIETLGKGSTVKGLRLEELHALNFLFPSISEQRKIASFLSKVDSKIDLLEKKLELWETYKKGIMQQIFSQKLRFKDENGEDYPDWEDKKLGDFGNFKNGVNKYKEDFGNGFPFVNLMDVFGKNSISKNNFDLVNVTKKELKEFDLIRGDVIFIRSSVKPSGVGLTAVIVENLPNTVYSGFLIRFREKKQVFDLNFKKYCFYSTKFRNSLIRKSSTSANTNINQESLKTLVVEVPSLMEQGKIASFLSSIDIKIEKLEEEIEVNIKFKKNLFQQMFC